MVNYKFKVKHDEYNTLHLSSTAQNRNDYPMKENNCGDDYITFLPDDRHVCDAVISENIYLGSNKFSESIVLVLSFIHIGGEKYMIYSRKTETAKILRFIKLLKILSLK